MGTGQPRFLSFRLSAMMFLQYAIWGAWLPLFWSFLTEHRGLTPVAAGNLFSIGAIGALFAPFLAGQIADRWLDTEKFLGISHLLGGVLVWQLARLESYNELLVFSLLYSLLYAPTLPLTNAVGFHHLRDRDRDFAKVRVWGTVGWIAVGIGIGHWLLHAHTPSGEGVTTEQVRAAQVAGMGDAFRLSAILGGLLGAYCFTLPKTPPRRGRSAFAPMGALKEVVRRPRLWMLFLIAFPISCIHQFYFVHTAGFLGHLQMDAPAINRVFGVGGGGLMTVGQAAELAVLAVMPLVIPRVAKKWLLVAGLAAYALRFAVFAYLPEAWAVVPALALHGLVFGCFIFVAFLVVDEETTPDVRASAQSMFNLIVIGVGVIIGNWAGGQIAAVASREGGMDYTLLFGLPMWVAAGCAVVMAAAYPGGRSTTRGDAPKGDAPRGDATPSA